MESNSPVKWEVAVSSGLFINQPILKSLPAIREAGFKRLEISGNTKHIDYHDRLLLQKVHAMTQELGMKVVSLHAPFGGNIDITLPDEDARKRAVAEVEMAIDALALLEGDTLVIHCGSETEGALNDAERRLNQSVISLKEINYYCRERKIRMCLENMLAHLLGGRQGEMERVLGRLQGSGAGTCLDTGHAFLAGDLLQRTRMLGRSISMVHAHDNRGIHDDHLPPGEGEIGWTEFLDTLALAGFAGRVVMEVVGRDSSSDLAGRAWRGACNLKKLCEGKDYTLDLEGCMP